MYVLERLSEVMLPAVETELRQSLEIIEGEGLEALRAMMAYHMGWDGDAANPSASGKRVRPLLALLSAEAAGGEWRCALPAAAALELVHNFSLIHDDIEDNSPLRRGRPTVWNKWGMPQAINTGDAMFTLAHLVLLRLKDTTSPEITLAAAGILQKTCLLLTQGQHMDMTFETRSDLTLEAYWQMVGGKTAALLGACTEIGALAGGAGPYTRQAYRSFGVKLGLAFQAQDDLLGIWGDSSLTGKSNQSDLVAGKKSLPVIYGLQQNGEFSRRWNQGPVGVQEVPAVASLLEAEGGRAYTEEAAERLTNEALQALETAAPQGEAGQALKTLAERLLNRRA